MIKVRQTKLDLDKELCYVMSALFMSVPIYKVLEVIRMKLKDNTLNERTLLELDIIQLLGFCLSCTYFLFQGEYLISRSTGQPWAACFPWSPHCVQLVHGVFFNKRL